MKQDKAGNPDYDKWIEKMIEAEAKHISIVEMTEWYLSKKYDFRNNIILSRTEYKTKNEKDFSIIGEREHNSILRELHLNKIKCNDSTLKSILASDYAMLYNPFVEYFKHLPKWDVSNDYIQELADTVETTNQSFWREAFKKWIVATVACAIYPEVINHEVIVLTGEQGKGKTTWLENLLPSSLKGYQHMGTIDPSNKDTLLQLSENFLINLDELENLNKNDLGALKSVITQGKIRVRKAFGKYIENYVRRASFVASVNDTEFLTDVSGNRRYLTFTALNINKDHSVLIDNVYSQAYYILQNTATDGSKFKYWFDEDDILKINANNEQYLKISVEQEMITKYFDNPTSEDEFELMIPTDMISYINKKEQRTVLNYNMSAKRFGQVLHKLGYEKTSSKNQKPYRVIRRNQKLLKKDVDNLVLPKSENPASNNTIGGIEVLKNIMAQQNPK